MCLLHVSVGNAGYATAYVGKQLGIPATVVIPDRLDITPEYMADRIRGLQAHVIRYGQVWVFI